MINEILAQSPAPGNYIAIWKLAIFVGLFGLWAWVGQWVDKDAPSVRSSRLFWNNVYLGAGLGAIVLWFIMPAPFIVGILLYLVAWLTLVIIYILHRNSRVPEIERILTLDHLKFLLSRDASAKDAESRLVFISSNDNELPAPHRQDKEYEGYVIAEEMLYDLWDRRVIQAQWLPSGENVQLRCVIDGVTCNAGERPREELDLAILYLKAVAGLDADDRRRPQTGDFTARLADGPTRWRIQTSGSTRGEQMTIIRFEEFEPKPLDALGLHADQLEKIEELIQAPQGLVLVTGPKTSGITSTLYSIIRKHDAFIQNIHSLEIATMCDLDNISQNTVEEASSSDDSAARRLQSVLLGDPDVLMVGFCDDAETAKVAAEAAGKGKKIYVALKAPGVFHALQQWIQMVGNNRKVAATLLAVVNQRLLRKLCPECRQAYVPNTKIIKRLNLPADKIKRFYRPPSEPEYDKRGKPIVCPHCQGTGYFGRTAVYETIFVSDALKELIQKSATINDIRAKCRKDKMLYLQEQAIRKVIDSTTSIHEVSRITAEAPGKKQPSPKPAAKQKTPSKKTY